MINHVCVCAVDAGRVAMKAVVIGWGQPYSHADTVDPHQLFGYREVLHV